MNTLGPLDVVTGAFSYSGAAIAGELQSSGRRVRTLTGHPDRAPAGSQIETRPLNFDDPAELTGSLRGAHTLYNTYWVRFAYGRVDHEAAVANSRTLFEAAARAGVERIVHVSITHPSADSPYPYFRGKAQVERILTSWAFARYRPPRSCSAATGIGQQYCLAAARCRSSPSAALALYRRARSPR
jgi:NADH dehydrogenase